MTKINELSNAALSLGCIIVSMLDFHCIAQIAEQTVLSLVRLNI